MGQLQERFKLEIRIIVIAYTELTIEEADSFKPKVAILDDDNEIVQSFEGLD